MGFITLVAVPIIAIGSVITERARNLGGKPREKDLY